MKINCYSEINYDGNFVYNSAEIQKFGSDFLENILKRNISENFSEDDGYSFEIYLCNNDFIQNINRDYRNKDAATDVITFALYNDTDDKIKVNNEISLGQIIISIDKAKKQAEENNVSIEYEFLNLLAHGVLHLLGFDHADDNSLSFMLQLQESMIKECTNVQI